MQYHIIPYSAYLGPFAVKHRLQSMVGIVSKENTSDYKPDQAFRADQLGPIQSSLFLYLVSIHNHHRCHHVEPEVIVDAHAPHKKMEITRASKIVLQERVIQR